MTSFRRALIGIAAIGLVGCVAVWIVVADSPYADEEGQLDVLAPAIAAAFIGTGLWAWDRRSENPTGSLMVAVGFAWLAATMVVSPTPVPYIFGWVLYLVPYLLVAQLVLSFPSGRLAPGRDRWLLLAGFVVTVVFQLVEVWVYEPSHHCGGCTDARTNPLLIRANDDLFHALDYAQSVLGIVTLIAVGAVLFRRRRAATPIQRHALDPVLVAGLVMIIALVITQAADLAGAGDGATNLMEVFARLAMACVPFAFLAGLARTRLTRAMAVADLVERLGDRADRLPLRDALAGALGDPGLRLGFRVRDAYVDGDGRPLDLPAGGHTLIERDAQPVGVLVHDPALTLDEPAALRAAAGAAALAIDNDRLEAELRARIDELQRSRSRLLEASDDARRRLERDLHDGAQQRLVALALTLRLARGKTGDDAAALLDEAIEELGLATSELRELARGIHPAILSDRGLDPALRALANRSPVPVEITGVPEERLPPPVESAAYFLVSEALTNVARYADASHATVSVNRRNGQVAVEVADDGVGGADPAAGSGLRGLRDRVAALDGTLSVSSPPGQGTTVRAELPCAS